MRIFLTIICAIFAFLNGVTATAQTAPQATPVGFSSDRELAHVQLDPAMAPSGNLDEKILIFIQLETPSVAEINAWLYGGSMKSSEQIAHATRIDQEQASMRQILANYDVELVGSHRVGVNGLKVTVRIGDIADIASLPGVRTVGRVETFVPDLENSIPWIGADALHADGIDGAGVSIAIIDTGIDYYHANFGGAGNPADYAADDPTIIEPGTFPTARVIIGTDFVGACDVGTPSCVITPDPDPLGVNFHGSHVGGIAAGNGVPGSIGPGVAPAADIWALKVFGDVAVSTNVVSDAIEFALDPNGDGDMSDHVDVINMSLGSSFGDPNSPSALASQNAAELGIIVVASAGNSGDVPYVTGSPAVAPAVISVAASVTGGLLSSSFEVTSNAGLEGFYDNIEAAFTPRLEDVGPVARDLVVADPLNGCAPLVNAADITGNIALIQRGACRFDTKGTNAEAAGATAFVVFNNEAGAGPIVMGGDPIVFIPGVMLGQADGDLLAAAEGGGADVEVNLDVAPAPQNDDNLAGFSSRGPGHGAPITLGLLGSQFKPDITAPGVSIVSTLVGSGTGAATASGTSMSAPHAAGLAALMHANGPSLTPFEIKAIMQNTSERANVDGTGGVNPYPVARQGAGVIRADRAVGAHGFASPGGVSFRYINPTEPANRGENITVQDLTGEPRRFSVTEEEGQTFPGVDVICPEKVNVPPHGHRTIRIQLKMDPSSGPSDDSFFSQREVDGWCVLEDGHDTLRVAYMAAVDPASRIKVRDRGLETRLRNAGPSGGFADGYTLAGTDGLLLDKHPAAIFAFGYRTFGGTGGIIDFGISTEEPWESMSAYEYDIFLDPGQDGDFEFVMVGLDLNFLFGLPDPDGRMATALFGPGGGFLEFFVFGDQNNGVAGFPIFREGPFGFLSGGDTTFDYALLVTDIRSGATDLQFGSIDLADEAIPTVGGSEAKSLFFPPGAIADLENGGAPNDMVWFMPNNQVNDQALFDSSF